MAPMCLSQYLVAEVAIADYPNSKQVLEKIENALQQEIILSYKTTKINGARVTILDSATYKRHQFSML